jgi:hypothetical protein
MRCVFPFNFLKKLLIVCNECSIHNYWNDSDVWLTSIVSKLLFYSLEALTVIVYIYSYSIYYYM